jgi:hypothetical protein
MSYFLLFIKFIIFIGTNLLIDAKVHKFLFYTLLCRNLHKYGKSPIFGEIRSFLKFVSTVKIMKILKGFEA